MNNISGVENLYKAIISYVKDTGTEIAKYAGNIQDIGMTKQYVTAVDLEVEKALHKMITSHDSTFAFYSEERHNAPKLTKHIWVCDPISGTKTFIEGKPHYGMSIAHTVDNQTVFAAIYDPSVDELFVSRPAKQTTLNNIPVHISSSAAQKKVVLNISDTWIKKGALDSLSTHLSDCVLMRNSHSFGVNYAWVAAGRYDGVVTMNRDSFPESAGSGLIHNAGGMLTTFDGSAKIKSSDRWFIGGNPEIHKYLEDRLANFWAQIVK